MTDTASEAPECPPWCARHRTFDDRSQLDERIDTHRAEPFWLRSAEDRAYFIAVTLDQMSVDGEPRDPQVGVHTHPESPNTVPIGMSVRQARRVAEALMRYVEQGESLMTERCRGEGCDRMTVASAEGLCDPCHVDALLARRLRLVRP